MPKPTIAIDTEMFRIYRKRAELSQKALAEKSRLSPSQVSRIERGKINPLFDTVNALAAAMGTGAHRWVADEPTRESSCRSGFWSWDWTPSN